MTIAVVRSQDYDGGFGGGDGGFGGFGGSDGGDGGDYGGGFGGFGGGDDDDGGFAAAGSSPNQGQVNINTHTFFNSQPRKPISTPKINEMTSQAAGYGQSGYGSPYGAAAADAGGDDFSGVLTQGFAASNRAPVKATPPQHQSRQK